MTIVPYHYIDWNTRYFLFFFLLASTGVILTELCLVLLYCSSIFGSILRYWVLPWTVNSFHILVLMVRFHLPQTLFFPHSWLSVMLCYSFPTVTSYVCYNILSLYQSIDIVVYDPLWRWFWMLLWQFLAFYWSMGQSSHIWRIDLEPWEEICNPCSICWIAAFQLDQSTKFCRYRLQ